MTISALDALNELREFESSLRGEALAVFKVAYTEARESMSVRDALDHAKRVVAQVKS